jgi:hypothetical protein
MKCLYCNATYNCNGLYSLRSQKFKKYIYIVLLGVKVMYLEKLQTDLDRLGDWVEGNGMKINSNKSKAPSFTTARVKDPLNYSLGDQKIPEANSCKYLGIIIQNDLSWADQVNYTVQKAWRALHL